MDTDWALKELSDFIALTELYRPPDPPGVAILGEAERALSRGRARRRGQGQRRGAEQAGAARRLGGFALQRGIRGIFWTWELQLPGDDDGTTALSFRRGVRAFAEGCFAAIRNRASHDVQDEISEQEALEQLAAFSVLARWVEASEVPRP